MNITKCLNHHDVMFSRSFFVHLPPFSLKEQCTCINTEPEIKLCLGVLWAGAKAAFCSIAGPSVEPEYDRAVREGCNKGVLRYSDRMRVAELLTSLAALAEANIRAGRHGGTDFDANRKIQQPSTTDTVTTDGSSSSSRSEKIKQAAAETVAKSASKRGTDAAEAVLAATPRLDAFLVKQQFEGFLNEVVRLTAVRYRQFLFFFFFEMEVLEHIHSCVANRFCSLAHTCCLPYHLLLPRKGCARL